jgi:hypothetical protein
MKRREIIRNLIVGALSTNAILAHASDKKSIIEDMPVDGENEFQSKWHLLPDMAWTGEDWWAQRLQDWCVKDGELCCLRHGRNRTMNLLTHQLSEKGNGFVAKMNFRFLNAQAENIIPENYIGFKLGVQGRFDDYRSAIFTGQGIELGITRNGLLFIGKKISESKIEEIKLSEQLQLVLEVKSQEGEGLDAILSVADKKGNTIASIHSSEYKKKNWKGNIALLSNFKDESQTSATPSISISKVLFSGNQLQYHPQQTFGPIYFAQYTVNASVLKLTAQLAPMDIAGAVAVLELKQNNVWKKVATSAVHPLARTVSFRIEKWNAMQTVPYRVLYVLTLRNGKKKEYSYGGTVAAEPVNKKKVKALAFSCNWDFGFPDNEVVVNASKYNADMVFFLGDQFYEPNGGFGVDTSSLDKSTLDYLRKWYMFGWSYRDLFRHVPMVALPDDHDVYHGNIWGSNGRASILNGSDVVRQDTGGYKMPADWVNMAQITQTSHMPDPYDAKPVLQGISVYYTTWNYAGISFGIVEDRKFKSAPKDVYPSEAKVVNGFAENTDYDLSKIKDLEAQLLGERQMNFLSKWIQDKKSNTSFKVLVSASPFCCLQTLPAGQKYGELVTSNLSIPEKGEYVKGDVMIQDMDSNGWPHSRRDEALKLLGKKMDLHLVGDQHLPAVVQYGVDNFRDNSFCFAVPALNNVWPRRWFPPIDDSHKPLPGKPAYTGDFKDAFGNNITVYAVANPFKTGLQPATLYDRATGYGVVEFDKENDAITLHCLPRNVDAVKEPNKEYDGWPITINKNREAEI